MTFAELVKRARESMNVTQDDLAALMGMPTKGGRVTVSYWETGERVPSQDQLSKLAACLTALPQMRDQELRREVMVLALRGLYPGENGICPKCQSSMQCMNLCCPTRGERQGRVSRDEQ